MSAILIVSCAAPKLVAESPDVLMQADRAFSDLSKAKGMKAAFMQYMDSNGILLRPGYYPLVGEAARSFLQGQNEGGATLTWEPQAAEMARSGDLGYTYGLFTVTAKDTTLQGTYISIWKKQKDGSWKFVLDTGNTGVGKK
jgi:ketosteroid isomerase-like protein